MKILPISDLPGSETAERFEGRDHGATVSFFLSHHPPGASVPLHRHPYEETFILESGTATFTVDDETVEVEPGQILIVPAGAAHGFANTGEQPLSQVSIHPSDHVVQEWLNQDR